MMSIVPGDSIRRRTYHKSHFSNNSLYEHSFTRLTGPSNDKSKGCYEGKERSRARNIFHNMNDQGLSIRYFLFVSNPVVLMLTIELFMMIQGCVLSTMLVI